MTVTLRTGNEALVWISSEKFIQGWESLLNDCSWSTACQHPDFIIPWYQIYKDRCCPVVVTDQAADESVVGIFTLALINGKRLLVGAGMVEAEYQCWIERPENGSRFIRKAIEEIRKAFPRATLHLKYMNGGSPLDWIEASGAGYFYRLQRHARPLMTLSNQDTSARLNSRKNRAKISKLRKSGEVSFERIEDHQSFIESFDEICDKYDARQKERNFVAPFHDDHLKGKFYIELHKRGILHATILNVGNQMAAFHAGLISRDWLHLGINGQSSSFMEHSPGKLHLLMLGNYLSKENFLVLDLTPGGDDYKELFANQHDTVLEFFLFPGFFSFLASKVQVSGKLFAIALLRQLNIRPAAVRRLIGRFRA